ncbi:MAG: DEAD/DEAH box helicase [Candidatus Tenebribacter davisii]|nr:DEAD/DEAH box helicase [Candidatus Tenebribacter davisii]
MESVQKWLNEKMDHSANEAEIFDGLMNLLSSFEVETDLSFEEIPKHPDGILYTLHNLIIRGMPTWVSYELEKNMADAFGLMEPYNNIGTIGFNFNGDDDYKDLLFRAMHIIEPRIDRNTAHCDYLKSWEKLGSRFEEEYLYIDLPTEFNDGKGDFFIQLMESQRTLDSMISIKKLKDEHRNNFREQKADFVIEYPYPLNEKGRKGVCIEIDGSQHNEPSQKHLDEQRDRALIDSNWAKTMRVPTSQFNDQGLKKHFDRLKPLLNTKYFSILQDNYFNPLYKNKKGLSSLELMLTPFAIARIQYSIIKAIMSRSLDLSAKIWNFAVIERDVPCAHLAIADIKRTLKSLFQLEGKSRTIPEINLTVYFTKEFENSKLKSTENSYLIEYAELDDNKYDLCIDISVLERFGLSKREINLEYDHFLEIRSSFSVKTNFEFLTTKRIYWRPLIIEKEDEDSYPDQQAIDVLKFFLKNIFRKETFRPGQLPILNRALQNKTVIGLLPTGAGKSLTYQLAGILQPGHSLVIDPIKSLMKDQVDGLARIGITGSMFINSSLKTVEREFALNKMLSGQALFCFVSPERLMIPAFRLVLENMAEDKRYFSYGVIDEVHCVSEWGHDFRTSYLSLGRNLLDLCKTEKGEIALFGLTATASYDVLSDVQRELSGNRPERGIPDEAIIRHETTIRDELQFHVEKIDIPIEYVEQSRRLAGKGYFELEIKKQLGELKQYKIIEIIKNASRILQRYNKNSKLVLNSDLINLTYESETTTPTVDQIFEDIELKDLDHKHFWNESGKNAALIFTPHRSWYFGVTDKYKSYEHSSFGLYESVKKDVELSNLRCGTFVGVNSDDEKLAQKQEGDNLKNQDDFITNKLDVMISTKAFGMGIDKPNIRLAIHLSYPGSIESYIQEAGRAGRDRKMAVSVLLFNDQIIADRDIENHSIDVDYEIQQYFYSNSFKGEGKEKAVLYEILTEIEHPQQEQKDIIAKKFKEDIGSSEIDFNLKIGDDYGVLFLNDSEKGNYGYIRLKTGERITDKATVNKDIANEYLLKLKDIINELKPVEDYESLIRWLKSIQHADPTPGIEKILNGLDYDENFQITIPFNNDWSKVYSRLHGLLSQIKEEITVEICRAKYDSQVESFLQSVFKEVNVKDYVTFLSNQFSNKVENKEEFLKEVKLTLDSRRDKSDTEKAIYRLSLIGVIDDYTVNYNAETFTLFGKKKTDEQYHQHLRNYISKYYSNQRTELIIQGLLERDGDSEIQRILDFTIGFVYAEVAKKRKEAIKAMKACCQVGLLQGNVEMKTWIHLYFNSKYARKDYQIEIEPEKTGKYRVLPFMKDSDEKGLYNASLLDWSDEGKEAKFDWIIDFIMITQDDSNNSQKDNLKHLRGACTRLLINNPDNYVFRLLRAFSLIVLEENRFSRKFIQSVSEDLEVGFENLWKISENNQPQYLEYVREYKEHVLGQITKKKVIEGFEDHINKIMFLSHVNWTSSFTEPFIKKLNKIIS